MPMLEEGEEGGMRLWHLVKTPEEAEGARVRCSSVRERERERVRAKAIPEIYLTRLLSMKVYSTAPCEAPEVGQWQGSPNP